MKHRLTLLMLSLVTAATPLTASAAPKEDEESQKLEARLEGYSIPVNLEKSSTTLTWMMLSVLGTIAVSALFKNSKRTHLD